MACHGPCALREGVAPVRDRLLATLFLAGLLHALSSWASPSTGRKRGRQRTGPRGLLASDELPEADRNDTATYLAQRTQLGSGNTPRQCPPATGPRSARSRPGRRAGWRSADRTTSQLGSSAGEQVLTTSAWSTERPLPGRRGRSGHHPQEAAPDRRAAERSIRARRRAWPGAAARPETGRALGVRRTRAQRSSRPIWMPGGAKSSASARSTIPPRRSQRAARQARCSRSPSAPTARSRRPRSASSSGIPSSIRRRSRSSSSPAPSTLSRPSWRRNIGCCASPTNGSSSAGAWNAAI